MEENLEEGDASGFLLKREGKERNGALGAALRRREGV
jgi:hypothetical protein